jgi:hypothetical protein
MELHFSYRRLYHYTSIKASETSVGNCLVTEMITVPEYLYVLRNTDVQV